MADILGKPFVVPVEEADASSMGAIAVAMKAADRISDWQAFIAGNPLPQKRIEPSPVAQDIYLSNYQVFTSLCQS
jgi:sugar (pentulose or hexulose) kinase